MMNLTMPLSWAEKHTLNLAYLQVIQLFLKKNEYFDLVGTKSDI